MNLGGAIHLNRTGIYAVCGILFILFIYIITHNNYYNNVQRESRTAWSPRSINLKILLMAALKAAENGGIEVVRTKDHLEIKSKGLTKEGLDDSVTTADFLSHCSMMSTLKHAYPDLNVISEEAKTKCDETQEVDLLDYKNDGKFDESLSDFWEKSEDVTVWIDPLDATHEYTEKLYDYVTTMVCVAVKGVPVIGVVHKPFSKETYWAWVGKSKSPNLITQVRKRHKLKITVSRSHSGQIKDVLSRNLNKDYELVIAAGAGYKALEVAKGNVDAYLHITTIKKWDICAGNAIINAMGGNMTTKLAESVNYKDSTDVKNEDGLIVTLKDHDFFIGKI